MRSSRSSSRTTKVDVVVAGDVRRLTGGNIYDAHLIRALRDAGIAARLTTRPSDAADVVVVDSIAFGRPLARTDAPVIALVHMPVSGRGADRVLERADRVVAGSPWLARDMRSRGARRVTVIRPGADGVARSPRRRSSAGSPLRVLCVANRARVKGTDVLVRAIARMPEVVLTVVGDGHPRSGRGHVVFRGPRRGRALARAYADADVVVVPSRSEGYGIVASEAIALGLPVIASDLPSLRAIVGSAGMLVRPSDVTALARAVQRMKDPEVRARFAQRARRRARDLPRWRDTERAFVSVVKSELNRRARRKAAGRRARS